MPAAHVTPRVFLSKWWLIRFNKTDAALRRTRHFDKWCSHSSLHQGHSKALRLIGILLMISNMHRVPVQNKHKGFCYPSVSESFFLRTDFFKWDFLNPQLQCWRRSEKCGTGFLLLLPSSAGWTQHNANSTFTQWWWYLLYLIIFCPQKASLSEWEMSGQYTKQPLTLMK